MPISIPTLHDTAGSRFHATVQRNKNLHRCTLKNRNQVAGKARGAAIDDLSGGFSRHRTGRVIATDRGQDAVRMAPGRRSRPRVARRVHVGHGRNQGGGARPMGRCARPRVPALRLFRPWRVRRPIRRRDHRPLARGKPRRVRCSLRRAPDSGGLVHGRMARAPARTRAAPGAAAESLARRARPHRAGGGFHRGADVEAVPRGDQA